MPARELCSMHDDRSLPELRTLQARYVFALDPCRNLLIADAVDGPAEAR